MSDIILPQEDKPNYVTIQELDNRPNLVLAIMIDPDTKNPQVIINSGDEGRLWTCLHRMEDAIRYHLQQLEAMRQATSIQAVPANVLDRLNGNA